MCSIHRVVSREFEDDSEEFQADMVIDAKGFLTG